jgi:hypothetical protein
MNSFLFRFATNGVLLPQNVQFREQARGACRHQVSKTKYVNIGNYRKLIRNLLVPFCFKRTPRGLLISRAFGEMYNLRSAIAQLVPKHLASLTGRPVQP